LFVCFLSVCSSLPIDFFGFIFCLFYYCGFSIFTFTPIIFFLFSLLFLYYQLNHHHPLIPTLTSFTLHPSPVLKLIAPLSNNSFCSSHPLSSPSPHLLLPFSPNLSPDYPSLLHTHHPLNNLLYQLYTTPNPCSP
jgi:hypothetical protein